MIELQNGWTKKKLKARIRERVPKDGKCSLTTSVASTCVYYNEDTGKSCAIGALLPKKMAGAAVNTEVTEFWDMDYDTKERVPSTDEGKYLSTHGPFPDVDDYISFQELHDNWVCAEPFETMHESLCHFVDKYCVDPKK